MITVSKEAAEVLSDIITHEKEPDYWDSRFEGLSHRDDTILRGCFGELEKANLIKVKWASDIPYMVFVLKDGYLYDDHLKDAMIESEKAAMSQFERELLTLIERAETIKPPIQYANNNDEMITHNQPSEEWMNDVQIFYQRYLSEHALGDRIKNLLFLRPWNAFSNLVSCLKSISKDRPFIDKMNGIEKTTVPRYQAAVLPEYDVFLSHASADKAEIVENLYESLIKLGVKIFYDKESIEWGDNWKEKILSGVKKAEFAIIVISENFFGREWTERELSEFLNRQNRNGQKLILPILHGIHSAQLKEKYPLVADIQGIDSSAHSCDEIAIMFAKQLIKRLKSI